MIIKKVDRAEVEQGKLPAGCVKVQRGEQVGTYRVTKDMTGETFISNLEQINKKRVADNT